MMVIRSHFLHRRGPNIGHEGRFLTAHSFVKPKVHTCKVVIFSFFYRTEISICLFYCSQSQPYQKPQVDFIAFGSLYFKIFTSLKLNEKMSIVVQTWAPHSGLS